MWRPATATGISACVCLLRISDGGASMPRTVPDLIQNCSHMRKRPTCVFRWKREVIRLAAQKQLIVPQLRICGIFETSGQRIFVAQHDVEVVERTVRSRSRLRVVEHVVAGILTSTADVKFPRFHRFKNGSVVNPVVSFDLWKSNTIKYVAGALTNVSPCARIEKNTQNNGLREVISELCKNINPDMWVIRSLNNR